MGKEKENRKKSKGRTVERKGRVEGERKKSSKEGGEQEENSRKSK